MYHLIVKDKVAEQHILGKYFKCNSFGIKQNHYVIALQKVDGQHI